MQLAVLFFVELFLLFLLSKTLTTLIASFFYRVTKRKKLTIYLLAMLFFPGTFIHEIAHYFMARILFVPVYKIEFFPTLHETSVKLGSVIIRKPDFIRNLLIGVAPFLAGTTLLLSIIYFVTKKGLTNDFFIILLVGYAVFEIGNTMFSSKKDLDGLLKFLLLLLVLLVFFFIFHIQLSFINPTIIFSNTIIIHAFEKGAFYLIFPIGLDIIVISILKLIAKF